METHEGKINITDDYMFGYVMRQPGICASMIECLLPGIHVADVHFKDTPDDTAPVQTQKTIQGAMGTHSVRLDVYLDDGHTVFNVEMQTGNKSNLPKRARFYGSRIDCDQLRISADYNELRPTYIIFICTYDPFDGGQYCYHFENCCKEEPGFHLGDESYKLFFNTKGTKGEISDELKKLLQYFNTPNSYSPEDGTELINKIDNFVNIANKDDDWRREYMTYAQAQLDARREGQEEGAENNARETAFRMNGFGLPLKLIAQYLGVSEQKVTSWLNPVTVQA